METVFTEQESLKIITEMIENSKAKFKDNGFFYLLWGWLVFSASILNFILIKFHFNMSWLPWPVLMSMGMIITWIAGYNMGKQTTVITFFDKAMMYLWNGFVVVLIIIFAMAFKGLYSWAAANTIVVLLYGFGTFVSGGLLKFKPLIYGGIGSWIIAIAMMFTPGIYTLLLTALSVVVAYLIPGYILKTRNNAKNVQRS